MWVQLLLVEEQRSESDGPTRESGDYQEPWWPAPPSLHATGERIIWPNNGQKLLVTDCTGCTAHGERWPAWVYSACAVKELPPAGSQPRCWCSDTRPYWGLARQDTIVPTFPRRVPGRRPVQGLGGYVVRRDGSGQPLVYLTSSIMPSHLALPSRLHEAAPPNRLSCPGS